MWHKEIKTGKEHLTNYQKETHYSLIDFWKWNSSNLVSNTTRGIFAEFIVATALDLDLTKPREEWAEYDLITPDGITIEVKSAAFIQNWKQKTFSKISFSIKQKHSMIYVFCLLKTEDIEIINPLDLSQWSFYVVSTNVLKTIPFNTISLIKLEKLIQPVAYEQIREEVKKLFK